MKRLLSILCLCLFFSAQSQNVLSLNPIFNEQDAILIPKVEGSWTVSDLNLTIDIHKQGDNFYLLKYGDSASPSIFEAVFIRIKNELMLDLSGTMKNIGDDIYRNSFIKGHLLFRVSVSNDSLLLSELNYDWFYDYTQKKKMPLKYEWTDNGMLLTLASPELKSFFEDHSEKETFHGFTFLTKLHSNQITSTTAKTIFNSPPTNTSSQQCKPGFPFKDGWLGADGDVSIAINKTTTIFIFSDTWLGRKDQQSRLEPGITMVANSVAVETCLPDGKTDIHYFWSNMYSDHQEAFFKSFTDRYRYWVVDGFMINNNLYVILQKVGQRQGVSSNEMFSFSLVGFTIVKITNPQESPGNWNIELNPVSELFYPDLTIQSHVILNNYVYFFVSRYDKALALVRKSLGDFDNPEKPYEYFALNKTWKEGVVAEDMDTVVKGFRCNTVNYHPDIKQWIMICDVSFMDNKIKMRTSPSFTGPWSEEKTIYEIPEVTPGNPSYDSKNFSYLPRECIQYYDPKKHEMLLTYDINNPDFQYIDLHPKVYTPKIITIPLMKYIGK